MPPQARACSLTLTHTHSTHTICQGVCIFTLSFRAHLKSVLSSLSPPFPTLPLCWHWREGETLPPQSRALLCMSIFPAPRASHNPSLCYPVNHALSFPLSPPCRHCAHPPAPPRCSCAQGRRLESEKCTRHVVASLPSNHPSLLPVKPQHAHPGPWLARVA